MQFECTAKSVQILNVKHSNCCFILSFIESQTILFLWPNAPQIFPFNHILYVFRCEQWTHIIWANNSHYNCISSYIKFNGSYMSREMWSATTGYHMYTCGKYIIFAYISVIMSDLIYVYKYVLKYLTRGMEVGGPV